MIPIYKSFRNLEPEKQQRIINAALKEFAENGYEQASTNRIVKNAGIGKGMLFYYFKSKLDLYEYLVDFTLEFVADIYVKRMDMSMREPDFIERLRHLAKIKTEFYISYPDLFNFLSKIFLEQDMKLPEKFQVRYEKLLSMRNRMLYENIDTSLFRNDVDTDKAFKLIQWMIEGYQNDLTERLKTQNLANIDFDPYWDEFYEYLDLLKKLFYADYA